MSFEQAEALRSKPAAASEAGYVYLDRRGSQQDHELVNNPGGKSSVWAKTNDLGPPTAPPILRSPESFPDSWYLPERLSGLWSARGACGHALRLTPRIAMPAKSVRFERLSA